MNCPSRGAVSATRPPGAQGGAVHRAVCGSNPAGFPGESGRGGGDPARDLTLQRPVSSRTGDPPAPGGGRGGIAPSPSVVESSRYHYEPRHRHPPEPVPAWAWIPGEKQRWAGVGTSSSGKPARASPTSAKGAHTLPGGPGGRATAPRDSGSSSSTPGSDPRRSLIPSPRTT